MNFVANPTGSVAPVVNLNALTGTAGLTYNVSAPITLAANTTFQGNGTATFKFSGGISGGFAIVKNGSSTLTLSGSNSYTAGTTINAGTLAIANDSALGTGTLTINDGGKLANNDTAAHTITNVIALSGSTNGITFTGSQIFTLNGASDSITAGTAVKVFKTGSSVLTINSDNGNNLAAGSSWTVQGGNYNSSTGLYDNVLAVTGEKSLGVSTNNR